MIRFSFITCKSPPTETKSEQIRDGETQLILTALWFYFKRIYERVVLHLKINMQKIPMMHCPLKQRVTT